MRTNHRDMLSFLSVMPDKHHFHVCWTVHTWQIDLIRPDFERSHHLTATECYVSTHLQSTPCKQGNRSWVSEVGSSLFGSLFRHCWATLVCQLCSFTTLFPQSGLPGKRSHGEKAFSHSQLVSPSSPLGSSIMVATGCHTVCSCLPLYDLLK